MAFSGKIRCVIYYGYKGLRRKKMIIEYIILLEGFQSRRMVYQIK